jgi:hypothetical protein
MNYDGFFEKLRTQMAERYGQPAEAMVLVHKAPGTGGNPVGRMLGSKSSPESRMHVNNALVMTPTHLHLVALGGRSGIKPRDEIAAWDRRAVVLDIFDTEKAAWLNTTMSMYRYAVHRVRICGPGLTMVVDCMQKTKYLDPAAELTVMFQAVGSQPAA